jgi:hypothetical protein
METYLVTKVERYTVEANSLDDAKRVWRDYETDGAFADDVEFVDTFTVVTESVSA